MFFIYQNKVNLIPNAVDTHTTSSNNIPSSITNMTEKDDYIKYTQLLIKGRFF